MRKAIVSRFLIALFIFSGLLVSPHPARADIAPPYNPPGASLAPGSGTTQVRMMAETVLIDVQGRTPEGSLAQARVTADFTMRNLGESAETLAVRFPISASDGRFNLVEIRNLQVQVNGRTVSTQRINGEDPNRRGESAPWAEFQASFPPGDDVGIRVSYLLEGTGYYPYAAFYYLLSTGAGWSGTIGSAALVVRLPYEADLKNVIFDEQIGWSQTTPGGVIDGREVRWRYEDLEPGREHNLEVSLVAPSVWQKALNEQANIARNPNDGEAWGRLGKVYKEITFLSKWMRADPGGVELYNLSRQAYEKCLSLLPNDALWHVGYADLLYTHYWMTASPVEPGEDSDLLLVISELHRALKINPRTAKALELAEMISWDHPDYVRYVDGQADFLALTATPTRAASPTPTGTQNPPTTTPEPTATPSPLPHTKTPAPLAVDSSTPTNAPAAAAQPVEETPTQTSPSGEEPGSGFCSVGLAPLVLVLMPVLRKRRRRGL